MKVEPRDIGPVSLAYAADKSASSALQNQQPTTQTNDATKLSLRSVSQLEESQHSDKIAEIKAKVAAGTYTVDSGALAAKLAVELM